MNQSPYDKLTEDMDRDGLLLTLKKLVLDLENVSYGEDDDPELILIDLSNRATRICMRFDINGEGLASPLMIEDEA